MANQLQKAAKVLRGLQSLPPSLFAMVIELAGSQRETSVRRRAGVAKRSSARSARAKRSGRVKDSARSATMRASWVRRKKEQKTSE